MKAILFDVYGTLATWSPDRYVIHSRAASQFGIEVTKEGINAGYAVAESYMTHENARRPIRKMTMIEREQFFAKFEQLVLQGCGVDVNLELAFVKPRCAPREWLPCRDSVECTQW